MPPRARQPRPRRIARGLLPILFLLLIPGLCGCAARNSVFADAPPLPEHRRPLEAAPDYLERWNRVRVAEHSFSSFSAAGLEAWPKRDADRWRQMRRDLRHAPLFQQMAGVNAFFNAWPHKEDREIWGQEEHWATPIEFANNSGDCEDYAIAKYYALRDLGLPAERLRIAGVWNRARGEGHGVLLVYDRGVVYVLDNATPYIKPVTETRQYMPRYLLNEDAVWLHMPQPGKGSASPQPPNADNILIFRKDLTDLAF